MTQGQGLLCAAALVWPGPGAPGRRFLSVPHLKTRNSKAAGIARRRSHRYYEGAVGNVLLVELDRDLVVTWAGREHTGHAGRPLFVSVYTSHFPQIAWMAPGPQGGGWEQGGAVHVDPDQHPHPGAASPDSSQALSTWLLDHISHTTGAVLSVLKGDLSLAGALNSNGQAPSASFPGPDAKFSCGKTWCPQRGLLSWPRSPPSMADVNMAASSFLDPTPAQKSKSLAKKHAYLALQLQPSPGQGLQHGLCGLPLPPGAPR